MAHEEDSPEMEELKKKLKAKSMSDQFKHDAKLWQAAIDKPGNSKVGALLKRVFTVIRHGGPMFRVDPSKPWRWWNEKNWPIAAAMSHGNRLVIQLGEETENFWKWLYGDGKSDYEKVTPKPNSNKKALATVMGGMSPKVIGLGVITGTLPLIASVLATKGAVIAYYSGHSRVATHGLAKDSKVTSLIGGRMKSIKETGLNALDLTKDRHWGVNVALGGQDSPCEFSVRVDEEGKPDPLKVDIVTGSFGHFYMYVLKDVGVMIGCEGSQPGSYDSFGHVHDEKATSGDFSPTGGLKWRDLPDGPGCGGEKKDCFFMDLTMGWEHIRDDFLPLFKSTMVGETSEDVEAVAGPQLPIGGMKGGKAKPPIKRDKPKDTKTLLTLREHENWKFDQWYAKGNFWLTMTCAAEKPTPGPLILISSDPKKEIDEAYIKMGKPVEQFDVVTGTYTSVKKKSYAFDSNMRAEPDDMEAFGEYIWTVVPPDTTEVKFNGKKIEKPE
jgi:uncharacterized membrane protein (UPF0136 family)